MNLSTEMKKKLVDTAIHARKWAYAPYSRYKVGAALLTTSGKIYDGVNVENVDYTDGICAERTAVFKAVSEGELQFSAIAVVSSNGGSLCGSCRQVLAEFGLNIDGLIADSAGNILEETTVADLLPGAFTPTDLKPE